jgi:hypothetical protein
MSCSAGRISARPHLGEHDTHAVWLHYGDKRFHAMEFTRDDRLDGTRDILRELGIRIER